MAITKVSRDLLNTSIVDNGNATAITIDSSENVTFSADIITASAGTSNFRAGVNAGNSIVSGGNYNVLVGDEAGTAITTGDYNVALGYAALDAEDAGSRATALGYFALSSQNTDTDSYNVAVGFSAGESVTTGVENTLIGGLAGDGITSGSANVALGYNSLSAAGGGNGSIAIGKNTLAAQNASGDVFNTAVGFAAGAAVTTGFQNTLIGGFAGDAMTVAQYNVCMGVGAMGTNRAASRNVAIGFAALSSADHAALINTHNVAIGMEAGDGITTGVQNTLVGALTETSAVGVHNEIVIGYAATGNGTVSATFGIGATETYIGIGNTSWIGSSDERLKENITASTAGLSFINDLRPVTFDWKSKGSIPAELKGYEEGSDEKYNLNDKTNHGFIAQEVKTVIDNHPEVKNGHNIWLEKDDGTQALAPSALVPMLVKALQEADAKIEALTTRITALES